MRRLIVVFAVLHCVFASAQEPFRVGEGPKIDSRAMVEALANRNAAPKHVGTRHEPIFDSKFDWRENDRAWTALKIVIQNAEAVWPELVSHLDDDRYCVTCKWFSGFTYDRTVGQACRDVILRNLSCGYFESISRLLVYKQPHLALQTPRFLRDPAKLKAWCEARREKKLYELQIEICEWAATEVADSEVFEDVNLDMKKGWIAGIEQAAKSLHETKTAVHWNGFGLEEAIPYSKESAEAIRKRYPSVSIDVQNQSRATVDELVEFAIIVRNTGDVPLHGVRVNAQLPDQLKHRLGSEVEFTIDELPIRGSESAILRVVAHSTGRATCRLHVVADEPTKSIFDPFDPRTEAEFKASIDVVDRPVRLESSRVTKIEPSSPKLVPAPIRTGQVPNSNYCCQSQPVIYEPCFIP